MKRHLHGIKKIWIALLIVMIIAALLAVGAFALHHYYFLLNRKPPAVSEAVLADPGKAGIEEFETDGEDYGLDEASDEELARLNEELEENILEMAESEMLNQDIFNILIIGVDSRQKDFFGRSDVMMLVTINKKNKKIVMTSFLRDSYVAIPGYENNRLNAAYAFGGVPLLYDTIKANYGILADHCVVVNFYLMMDMVDAVGGIDVELSAAEIEVMNQYITSENRLLKEDEAADLLDPSKPGRLHLNGKQALAYCRDRYTGNDFSRTAHQRKVIMELKDKIMTLSIPELNALLEEFLPQIVTDLSYGDCLYLLTILPGIGGYTIDSFSLPVENTYDITMINGMSVVTIDFPANAAYWKKAVYGTEEDQK